MLRGLGPAAMFAIYTVRSFRIKTMKKLTIIWLLGLKQLFRYLVLSFAVCTMLSPLILACIYALTFPQHALLVLTVAGATAIVYAPFASAIAHTASGVLYKEKWNDPPPECLPQSFLNPYFPTRYLVYLLLLLTACAIGASLF
jgi:hypothetical protein